MKRSYSSSGGSRWHGADDEGLLGFVYGSTSSDGQWLRADDGGVRQRVGGIRSDAIDDPRFQRGRAQGFFGNTNNSGNPRNFGPSDAATRNGLDMASNRRAWAYPDQLGKRTGDPGLRQLKNRNLRSKGAIRRTGGDDAHYYGGPSRRLAGEGG
jgi:hypothetical protein